MLLLILADGYTISKSSLWKGYANFSLIVTVLLTSSVHFSVLSDDLNPAVNENAKIANTYTLTSGMITNVVSRDYDFISLWVDYWSKG